MMIRAVLTIISCLLITTVQAQTPGWTWAKSAGSAGTDNAFSIAAHSSGSTYVTGQFGASSIRFGNTTLTNAGSLDIFIVKYDASGNVLWAKSAGGRGFDGGYGIATDSMGNCYVTGSFEDTIIFDNVTLSSAGAGDIFVAKFDASGNLLWAKSAGSAMIDGGTSIAVDQSGNSYVTGYYNDDFTFGGSSLTNLDYEDLFIAKYDTSGNVVWVQGIGGHGVDWSTDIATDKGGNVYLTGWYNSDGLDFGGTFLANTGQNDMFIVRFTPAGNVLWARNAGSINSEHSRSIAVDGNNNSFITGYYTGYSIGGTPLPNAGGIDAFIAKYDSAGNAQWAKGSGGSGDDLGYAVAVGKDGNCYVTGWFRSDSISFGNHVLHNAGSMVYSDFFVTRYDPSGNVVWAQSAGDAGTDVTNGIDLDGVGNCYITGTFSADISFGTDTLHNVGGDDAFVVKIPIGKTGIKEVGAGPGFKIFPNPVSAKLHIRRDGSGTGKQTLQVFDCTGRLMMSKEISTKETSIDTQQWPAGLYGIRIGQEWAPIVKQ